MVRRETHPSAVNERDNRMMGRNDRQGGGSMRNAALVPLLALLIAGTSGADDPPKPGTVDPQAAARSFVEMEDSLYAEMREHLAKQPLEDALRVLDEVRRLGRDP